VNKNLPGNIVDKDYSGNYYSVFYSSEIKDWMIWHANNYNYAEATFGPYEVNFNYYPSWEGHGRIVVQKRSGLKRFEMVSGGWGSSMESAAGCYGNIIQYARGDKEFAEARWTSGIPAIGRYEVFALWTQGSNRATAAPYKIHHVGGTKTVRVNQRKNGGKWNNLGVYTFSKDTPTVISISNDSKQYVFADVIKLVPQGEKSEPEAHGGAVGEKREGAIIIDNEDFPF